MKKLLLPFAALLAFGILLHGSGYAQCTPDSNFTAVGFTPNPLPEGCVGVSTLR